jgi:hypothetical protein
MKPLSAPSSGSESLNSRFNQSFSLMAAIWLSALQGILRRYRNGPHFFFMLSVPLVWSSIGVKKMANGRKCILPGEI